MEKSDNKENLNKINWNILGILTTFWKWSDEITESRRQNWGTPQRDTFTVESLVGFLV